MKTLYPFFQLINSTSPDVNIFIEDTVTYHTDSTKYILIDINISLSLQYTAFNASELHKTYNLLLF